MNSLCGSNIDFSIDAFCIFINFCNFAWTARSLAELCNLFRWLTSLVCEKWPEWLLEKSTYDFFRRHSKKRYFKSASCDHSEVSGSTSLLSGNRQNDFVSQMIRDDQLHSGAIFFITSRTTIDSHRTSAVTFALDMRKNRF